MKPFKSAIAQQIEAYIAYRKDLGVMDVTSGVRCGHSIFLQRKQV